MSKAENIEWRQCPIFDKYEVSNTGGVRNKETGIVRKPRVNRTGRLDICIYTPGGKRRFSEIHRLVATAFIPNPENKPQVNHINSNPLDNRVENLEWATGKENIQHFLNSKGTGHLPVGSKHKMSKLTEDQVLEIRQLRKDGVSAEAIRKRFNIGLSMTYNIINKTHWKHI